MKFESIIHGGTIVTPDGTIQADIGIIGEKIAAISGISQTHTYVVMEQVKSSNELSF